MRAQSASPFSKGEFSAHVFVQPTFAKGGILFSERLYNNAIIFYHSSIPSLSPLVTVFDQDRNLHNNIKKLADKPGSVVDSHSSGMIVTNHL